MSELVGRTLGKYTLEAQLGAGVAADEENDNYKPPYIISFSGAFAVSFCRLQRRILGA